MTPMGDEMDAAEVRAEGRRLRDVVNSASGDTGHAAMAAMFQFFADHADVLLADPAPVGLTEDEREALDKAYERWCADKCDIWDALDSVHDLINIIDRLSAAPVGLTEEERRTVEYARAHLSPVPPLVAIIDRLSAAPRAEREALERIANQGRRKPSDTGLCAVDLAAIARDALAAPAPAEPREGEVLLDGKRELVPEGYEVVWEPGVCGWCNSTHDHADVPRLVPTDAPEEG